VRAYVQYTAQLRAGPGHGGRPSTSRRPFVFDSNAALNTATVTNTIDAGRPRQHRHRVADHREHGELRGHRIPAVTTPAAPASRRIRSTSPTTAASTRSSRPATVAGSATFNGQNGHTYAFYCVATDNVGNAQATPHDRPRQTTTVHTAIDVTSSIGQTLYGGTYNRFTHTQYMNLVLTDIGPTDLTGTLLVALNGLPVRHGAAHLGDCERRGDADHLFRDRRAVLYLDGRPGDASVTDDRPRRRQSTGGRTLPETWTSLKNSHT